MLFRSTLGDNTIVSAVAARSIVVLNYILCNTAGAANTVIWKSGSTAIAGARKIAPSTTTSEVWCGGDRNSPLLITNSGEALVLNLSAATQVSGHLTYILQ